MQDSGQDTQSSEADAVARERVAFAIGGLGGNNSHGAGFLMAASETQRLRGEARDPRWADPARATDEGWLRRATHGLMPEVEFISCTSGAMLWVARYLQGGDLRAELRARCREVDRALGLAGSVLPRDWRVPLLTWFTGVPGVFRPMMEAYGNHWWRQVTAWPPHWPRTATEWYDLLAPAQWLIPDFPDELIENIADTFNDNRYGVGVAFNSFNPRNGLECVHVNETGMDILQERDDIDYGYVDQSLHLKYAKITPEDVRGALHLFAYGFPDADDGARPVIDGAYARSIILNELAFAKRIYAVMPLNPRWIGRLPRNWFEVQDMRTERWFDTSYREQVRMINKITELAQTGWFDKPKPAKAKAKAKAKKEYHKVELVPVELATQRGYFEYFAEDPEVFEAAYAQGLAELQKAEGEYREQHRTPAGSGTA